MRNIYCNLQCNVIALQIARKWCLHLPSTFKLVPKVSFSNAFTCISAYAVRFSLHTTVRLHTLPKQGLWLSSQEASLNRINPKVFLKYQEVLILPMSSFHTIIMRTLILQWILFCSWYLHVPVKIECKNSSMHFTNTLYYNAVSCLEH